MGDRPRHEHCQRHDGRGRAEVGGVRDEPDAGQVVQPASAGILQRRGRPHVLAAYHLPDGRLPQRRLRILRKRCCVTTYSHPTNCSLIIVIQYTFLQLFVSNKSSIRSEFDNEAGFY